MEILDPKKSYTKAKIPAGTFIAVQGDPQDRIFILHSGFCEALYIPPEVGDPRSSEAIEKGIRIGFAQGQIIVGASSLFRLAEGYQFSMRTVTDCIVSVHPVAYPNLIALIDDNSTLFVQLLNALVKHMEHGQILYDHYMQLWNMARTIADGLFLGSGLKVKDTVDGQHPNDPSNRFVYAPPSFVDEKLGSPESVRWSPTVFSPKIQKTIIPGRGEERSLNEFIDIPQIEFLTELVRHSDGLLIPELAGNQKLASHLYNALSFGIGEALSANAEIAMKTYALMDQLYGENGWCAAVRNLADSAGNETSIFLHELARCSLALRKPAAKLLGIDLKKYFPVFYSLRDFKTLRRPPESETTSGPGSVGRSPEVDVARYAGILRKILDFAGVDDAFRERFVPGIEAFINDPNPDVFLDDLGQMFWSLYEKCFLKAVASDLNAFVPGIFLHFGLIDERLLSADQLTEIDGCYRALLFREEPVPVMTFPYFLEMIYSGRVDPSMNEMGDQFSDVLRAQTKLSDKEREKTNLFEDSPEDRVRYEIHNVAKDLQAMLYGSRSKPIPFLLGQHIPGNMRDIFSDPDHVEHIVKKYHNRDFSMFYREVLHKNDQGREFIQKEVIPNFILYPGTGSRMVMWQEMDGKKKDSAGRIFMPVFHNGKMEDALITQISEFRWILQKSIAGSDWTDPVEGGLVGAYFDYITYFKKNPKISSEAKQRLAQFVKRTKSEKERFSIDYRTWVEGEYDGIPKLTPAAREIFFRYCPFPGEKRKEMAVKPAYENMEMKFQNRRNKELLKLKSRFMKYEKAEAEVPLELADYREYLER
jgi:hypothetical protein